VSKRKLLLADDSVTIQKVVNLTFADEGIEVIAVGDGDSAMDRLAEISPDLVMADVNMPGLNGYQICEQIKQDEVLRQTPVILLVGSFEPFDEDEARRVGADDYLTKPFQSIRQLVNKVTVLLNSERDPGPADERHLADTLEMENPKASVLAESFKPIQFEDSAMDDEMIQTDQVSNYSNYSLDESARFETREPVDDVAKTQPLTGAEMKDFDFSGAAGERPGEEHSPAEEAGEEESLQTEEAIEEELLSPEDGSEDVAEVYEPVAETTDGVEEFVTGKTEVSIESEETNEAEESDERQEVGFAETSEIAEERYEEPQEIEASFEEAQETEATVEDTAAPLAETHEDAIPMPESASILASEEGDLLELPPIEYEDEQEDDFEAETVPEAEPGIVNESLSTPVEVVQNEKTETLSPDLIEAIANRVMEKLSEKAVKEVAWEVVPQMTELIVKKIAEEKLKE
jgi:CheY-like chemotaxis protein